MTTDEKILYEDNESLDTAPPARLPVIDFAPFLDGRTDLAARKQVGKQLVKVCVLSDQNSLCFQAFHEFGFIYLNNFGVSADESADMFALSKAFFKLPLEDKMKVEWLTAESNRGELDKAGRQEEIKKLREQNPDMKETFEIGKEDTREIFANRWPQSMPGMKEKAMAFFSRMQDVNVALMQAIALGFELEKDALTGFVDASDNTLRLLHYPSVERDSFASSEARRIGAHCDYGSLTLLFQDESGGLEVLDHATKKYIQATPIPGTIVVNVGDMFQRWTNDYFKSTLHR
ncbi:MAG: hypothetical protein SGCHY_004315 [Lobulomycetales sp.]